MRVDPLENNRNTTMLTWISHSLTICGIMLAPYLLFAQKIGYVSTDAIRAQFEASKQATERLTSSVDQWKAEVNQRQRDIEELELEIRKNRLIWSDQERVQKEKDVDEKRRERDAFARGKFEPGGEHDQLAESLFKAVWSKIYAAVQKVSANEGYDIVWDKSVQPLVYVNAKYDITVKVMKELGIDADDLEKKQREVVDADPRNKRAEEPRKRRSRSGANTESLESNPRTVDTTNTRAPVLMPDGTMPSGLPPTGEVPGGGPARANPPYPMPNPTDTTKRQDVPR